MKKLFSGTICLLLVLVMLFPLCKSVAFIFGYTVELTNATAYMLAIVLLSGCATFFGAAFDTEQKSGFSCFSTIMVTPLCLIDTALLIFDGYGAFPVICGFISAGCGAYLTIKYSKRVFKAIGIAVSAVMLLFVAVSGVGLLIFGGMSENTIVKALDSSDGRYCARVIENDQGALGGNTFVDVYKNNDINAVAFRFKNKPQRMYECEWGESEAMRIYWKDADCLVINSTEYTIAE